MKDDEVIAILKELGTLEVELKAFRDKKLMMINYADLKALLNASRKSGQDSRSHK